MIATWFGGPHDGSTLALPDDLRTYTVPIPIRPELDSSDRSPTWRQVRMPIEHTDHGWIIHWTEH